DRRAFVAASGLGWPRPLPPCSGARWHGRPRLLKSGLLASVNERLRVFHRRRRQNAVPEVENVSVAGGLGNSVERGLKDFFLGRVENRWIEITLKGHARAGKFADFTERSAPIDAQNIGSDFRDIRQEVVRGFSVVDDRHFIAEAGNDFLDRRQNELGVITDI